MANEEAVGPNIRVADILEQIERLDKMIAFHKLHSPDDAMLKQYKFMRQKFSKELSKLMERQYRFKLFPLDPVKQKAVPIKTTVNKALRPSK